MEANDEPTKSFVPLTKGTEVGQYRIINKIDEGGMGEVYLAEDTKLNNKVALKFLASRFVSDESSKERFTREAQAVASLDHPNIVTIHELNEYKGRPYFAMQYVQGQSLWSYAKQTKLSTDRVVELAMQLCEGLQAAHEKGITHRDIKPSNILIDSKGRLRIVDFGLATVRGTDRLTKTGSTLGTVGYMSPEQVRGEKVDHRSDLFSMGVVLYELLSGLNPFKAESEAATMHAITQDNPQPLARFNREVPDELQRIIDKALAKDVSLRYQHADGMLSDLKRLKMEPVPTPPRKIVLWVATAVVVLAAGYFIYDQYIRTDSAAEEGWTNSVAVLIFRNLSSDPEQDYFCEGMTDAIIGKLSGIKNLKVISMTSVLRYKTLEHDLKKIGHDLQVNTILEGSIQIEGDRMRLQAQLINVADDSHIWSHTYERELKSMFAVQDDISRAIVDALRIELMGNETSSLKRRHTENVEAFEFYSRGRHLWNKRTEEDLRKAIEYFERAIELDSSYALAWSGLADGWAILPGYSDALDSETMPKARDAAERALQIDQNLAEAHASIGLILRKESDLQGAERGFQRSIELNSGYHWARYWYSKVLGRLGRFREQTEQENLAFELNPMSIALVSNRAARKKATYEFQEAEEMYQRLIEIEPNRWTSYIGYADLLAMTDRKEEALKQCSLAVQINKEAYKNLAFIYDRVGDFDGALQAANKYIEFEPDNPNSYDTRGYIYALYGQFDSAISSYEKALELKPDFAISIAKLGAVYVFQREYEKAESLYQALASHSDKNTRAWGRKRLTFIPAHQGKFKEAFRMLNKLEALAVSDSLPISSQLSGHWKKAIYYLFILDEVELARAELEYIVDKLMETEANHALMVDAKGIIAQCYARMGDFETANRLMKELGKVLDNYEYFAASVYWISFGRLEGLKGNYDLSSIYLKRAALTMNAWLMWRFYAQSLVEAGRPHEAIEIYERIVDRYDRHRAGWAGFSVPIHYWLGQAYEEAGRNSDAVAQYKIFLDSWKNADSGIPSVEDAKERLASLRNKL